MHIPDGMLTTQVAAASGAAGLGAAGYAVGWVKRHMEDRRIVLMSVLAALVFALQMINIPIGPGVSGHFCGAVAAAILVGLWPAVILMTSVVLVQALVFADGGIVALGANILNLAVVGPVVGAALWGALEPAATSRFRRRATAFLAAWAGVVATSVVAAAELWLSGRIALAPALAVLGGWHAVIGVGEGVLTAGLVDFVAGMRPDMLEPRAPGAGRRSAVGLGVLALAAGAASWLSSSRPDVLEWFAASRGIPASRAAASTSVAESAFPWLAGSAFGTVLAALLGIVLTGMLLAGALSVFRRRSLATHERELHLHEHDHVSAPRHEHPHHHTEDGHEHPHTSSFERYTYIVSPLHSLDARTKVGGGLLLVLGIVLSPLSSGAEVALMAVLLLVAVRLARVPVVAVLKRSMLVLPVAAAFALYAPFTVGGWPAAYSIVSRAWLSASIAILVAATTPPAELVDALRRFGMPGIFVTTLTFVQRFSAVLSADFASVKRAISSRAASLGGLRLLPVYGRAAGSLVIRSYERGERVYAAMLSRGFSGDLGRTERRAMRLADCLALSLSLVGALALFLY